MTSSRVFRRRLARASAGAVGVVLGIAMFLAPIAELEWGPAALLVAWLAMVPAYVSGALAGRWLRPRDLEFWGLWLPMAALSVLLPITLHMVVMALEWNPEMAGRWMLISGVVVGHVHLLLIGLCAWFVSKLRRDPEAMSPHFGWLVLSICVTASCVPGLVLFALPPMLTAVTGIVFIPAMFYLVHFWLHRERAEVLAESLVHPTLEILPGGLLGRTARGDESRVRWTVPFRVAIDRDPELVDGTCDVHVRLFQGRRELVRSVALTLALPAYEGLRGLSAASRILPRVHGPAAVAIWETLLLHANLHGVELPAGMALRPPGLDRMPRASTPAPRVAVMIS